MGEISTFNLEKKMQGIVDHLVIEFQGIRTGRAHPGLVSEIKVDYYGATTPLKQLATISVPEARCIVIAPFDKNVVNDIEKAILTSGLGINPQNDGQIVRLNLPELTGERRKELTKMVHKYAEEARIGVRNLRRDCNDFYKKKETTSEISEDNLHDYLDEIQKVTDKFITEIDQVMKDKEEEILTKI